MSSAPDTFVFFQVSSKDAKEAFDFHLSLSSDEHILPRTHQEIEQFTADGELFGVHKASSGEYVGLCYVHLEGDKHELELGGLTVSDGMRRLHVGSVLASFALAHSIANQNPWKYGQEVIAHVHQENQEPRSLLTRIGFEHIGTETLRGDKAPASMKRNEEGNVVGDKFLFPRTKVAQLADWFDKGFDGTLADRVTRAIFHVRPGGVDSLKEALREAASEYRNQGIIHHE